MPAFSLKGSAKGLITSGLKFSAAAMFSPTVRPLAVTWSVCSRWAISFITTGSPPA